jgi:hypothetical protein
MSGRGWGYAGAVLGGAVSVAANVAHSYVPPLNTVTGWAPPVGAVIGAVFWPVALFVAVEIFARTSWQTGRRWVAVRFGGLLPVAFVAAVVSYRHLAGLLAHYREDWLTATIGPLAVDGLMVMATAALISTSARYAVTPTPNEPRTGTPRRRRTKTRTDADLVAALADVPHDKDGTVPVRRAAAALGTGPDRARRLLRSAGLLRTDT